MDPTNSPPPSSSYPPPPPGYPQPPGYPPYPPYGGQQPYGHAPYVGGQPPSAVGWVVVGFIFFWPMGIASLLAQLKIGPAWYAGDRAGAEFFAGQARTRGKIALAIGLLFYVLGLILFVTVLHRIRHSCANFELNC